MRRPDEWRDIWSVLTSSMSMSVNRKISRKFSVILCILLIFYCFVVKKKNIFSSPFRTSHERDEIIITSFFHIVVLSKRYSPLCAAFLHDGIYSNQDNDDDDDDDDE